ncbi:MAG: tyrosine-type recombinase/integrase [Candidatus Korobacteraceae bacterium]
MRRKRQQAGTIYKARGTWYVRYFEDRVIGGVVKHVRVAKQIAAVTTRGKRPPRCIEDQASAIVKDACVANSRPERVLTIGDFVEQVYFPHIEQYKRPSTRKGYRDIWDGHVGPRCSSDWLKDVRTYHVQGWLDSMGKAGTLGRNSLKHIKSFMSAIFKLAKQQGYYGGENPVRDTAISPKATEPQETHAYDLDEIQAILRVLPETAGTAFAVASFAGLRRSELQGLLWENYQDRLIRVTQAVWEGRVTEPKTRRSKGAVPVIKPLAQRLELYRMRCGNPQNGPMFRNQAGKPMNLNNLLHREILPALNRCKHCLKRADNHMKADHDFEQDESVPRWHGWHAARRGLGSNLYALGVSDKVIQDILRHANVSTTNTYYIKTASAQVTDAMEKLERALPDSLTVN